MDIEFHYYVTYLIAAKAGFNSKEAYFIAYASQFVDDNNMIFEINKNTAQYYKNYISQTMNILKPKKKLFRIYPLFHFIPGDPKFKSALRKDGKMHWLNTTPDSKNANKIVDRSLETKNLYRIGIAIHSYADTWAHQNFTGYYDEFNSMSGLLESALPDIGHADAQHNPDWPALIWQDKRLLGTNERVDNKQRFKSASRQIFKKLYKFKNPNANENAISKNSKKLLSDLDLAIGEMDQNNSIKKSRIARYLELSEQNSYGEKKMKEYDEDDWFDEAVNENVRGLRDKSDQFLTRWDPFTDKYTWKNPKGYKNTHWYKFQQAVIKHQNDAWDILKDNTFSKLELESL